MNRIRIGKIVLIAAALAVSFAAGASAADVLQKVDAYLRPDFTVQIDGKKANLGTPPLVYNGSSYLPLRALGEALGVNVGWDESTKTIIVNRPSANVPGAGTGSGGATDPTVVPEKEILLENLMTVKAIYQGEEYPVLANLYKGVIYLRFKDVAKVPVHLGNLPLSTEKITKETYVHIDLIRPKWEQSAVTTDKLDGPVSEVPLTKGQMEELKHYFSIINATPYAVKAGDEPNEYMVIAKSMGDVRYVEYSIYMRLSDSNKEDSWVVSGSRTSYLEEDDDD
jgi:hypothetical protein